MQYKIEEVGNYQSLEELMAEYYGSRRLEVRAGIIHALLREAYDSEKFPQNSRIKFLLNVCEECLGEAHKVSVLNHETPYPELETPREERMSVTKQKNTWMARGLQFSKIASQCMLSLIDVYLYYRENRFGGEKTQIDTAGDKILKLLSGWESAPYVSTKGESQGRKIEKFLEIYAEQHQWEQAAPPLPSAWYQAVIHTHNFDLFYDKVPTLVKQELTAYIKVSIVRDKDQVPSEPKLSDFSRGKRPGTYTTPVIEFLIELLQKTGELDSVFKFGDLVSPSPNPA